MVKKLSVALATALVGLLAWSWSEYALFPPEDNPQNTSTAVLPIEFARVMSGVFAVVFTAMFMAGARWLASQLWAAQIARRRSNRAEATGRGDSVDRLD
jgi:hypothetical protein